MATTKAASKKGLNELFHDTLKDIYFAEKKILATLPKMAKAAQSQDLKAAFEKHRGQTEQHVARLEEVFGVIDKKPVGKTCAAIMGITEEGAEIIDEYKGSPSLDAGLLAAAQAVEHYEISRYGTLRTWAAELGLTDAVNLLDRTLSEEKETDAALSELAESAVNIAAECGGFNSFASIESWPRPWTSPSRAWPRREATTPAVGGDPQSAIDQAADDPCSSASGSPKAARPAATSAAGLAHWTGIVGGSGIVGLHQPRWR